MKVLLALFLLLSSPSAFADATCAAFPKCGAYTCESYTDGKWKDASGAAVEGAFILTNDFATFQLVLTDDGTTSGNPVKVLAECTR